MTTPYVLFLVIILLGIFGSLFTLVSIVLTFLRERKDGTLW